MAIEWDNLLKVNINRVMLNSFAFFIIEFTLVMLEDYDHWDRYQQKLM